MFDIHYKSYIDLLQDHCHIANQNFIKFIVSATYQTQQVINYSDIFVNVPPAIPMATSSDTN